MRDGRRVGLVRARSLKRARLLGMVEWGVDGLNLGVVLGCGLAGAA
jgi:hypothetical protein